jgi:hypothetical protein
MQITTLSSERKRYLHIVEAGIDNALIAMEKNDYEQAYRELTHIHHLPLLIIHFEEFDKDFYKIAFLEIYLKHSAPEYKAKIENIINTYPQDDSFIVVDKPLIHQLQRVYKDIVIARNELRHVLAKYPTKVAESLRDSQRIIHQITHYGNNKLSISEASKISSEAATVPVHKNAGEINRNLH